MTSCSGVLTEIYDKAIVICIVNVSQDSLCNPYACGDRKNDSEYILKPRWN